MSNCIQILEHNQKKRGFFSVVLLTLNGIDLCVKNKIPFSLDVLKLYGDRKNNDGNWSYFFKPFDYCFPTEAIELSNLEWFQGRPNQKEFNLLAENIKKYVKLNETVLEKFNVLLNKYTIRDRVGIHIRRTDHGLHGNLLDFSVYEKIIQEEIKNKNEIFIATDDIDTILYLKKYENFIVFTDSIRVNGKMGIHWSERNKTENENLKSGYDVLLDTLLLSSCKKAYFTNSNIATYAISNSIAESNPLEYIFIDNDIEYH